MAKGSPVSALSRSQHSSLLPGHLFKQRNLITSGITKAVGRWGWCVCVRVDGRVYIGVLLKKPRRKENTLHSTTPISRHTPPSMAKDCPGTVPGGNLDMCVCRQQKKTFTQWEKEKVKKKADLYGEKEMPIEFWFLRFLYNHQSSVQLAPEKNISFFRALYKLRSSNTGFREKPNNFLWASIWWLWLSAELNYCIPLSELQIQHQHPNPLRLMLHSSRRLAAQPNHTTTTTFLTAWWVNRNVEKVST